MNNDHINAHPLAIEVDNLECRYDERTVLRDVTFNVKRGEIFFVIGGSGCGKSTLLRHMIGLHTPAAGTVKFEGKDFTWADARERKALLRTFGVLYQSGALWSSMTLAENVSLPIELFTELTKKEREAIVRLKLAQVGLAGYEDYFPSEISGGMKKRAGLARALALDPSIVFFDEPSAGLDPITSLQLDELVLQIRETLGTTIVIVSHELASIYGIADRIIMLDRKTKGIIAEGDPRVLRDTSPDERVKDFLNRRGEPAGQKEERHA
ncbi:ABC transporter ATP-binding protein [Oleiharenicola lentus]|uniref:ABC transporter ATP-binding protein n=1 Tax=Oleiharenicola lentus TaxID=2508720 RepID=UPI003F666FCF